MAGVAGVAGAAELVSNMDRPDLLDRRRVVSIASEIKMKDEIVVVLPFHRNRNLEAVGFQQGRSEQAP